MLADSGLPPIDDTAVLVGTSTADDVAVYHPDDERALVQTVDLMTPIVDDPYDYGQIAAANSLSNVHAMGATHQDHLTSYGQSNCETTVDESTRALSRKYQVTSWFYDILDYPWERQYRRWRPFLLAGVKSRVLEAGVGTGRDLRHYGPEANVTGVDLSPGMMWVATRRARMAICNVMLLRRDAARLSDLPSDHFDWYIATFLFCVLPDELQPLALAEMVRVLKPGGQFRILEIIYSNFLIVFLYAIDGFWNMLRETFGNRVVLNGHRELRLPNTLDVSFVGNTGSEVLSKLEDIAASTGSVCHAGTVKLSTDLEAMGIPPEVDMSAIRFSLGRTTTLADIEYVVERLKDCLASSP